GYNNGKRYPKECQEGNQLNTPISEPSIAVPSLLTAIDRYVRASFAVHQLLCVWNKLLCSIKIDAVGHRSFVIATALQDNKLILILAPLHIVQFTSIQFMNNIIRLTLKHFYGMWMKMLANQHISPFRKDSISGAVNAYVLIIKLGPVKFLKLGAELFFL